MNFRNPKSFFKILEKFDRSLRLKKLIRFQVPNDCSGGSMGKFTDYLEAMFRVGTGGQAEVLSNPVEVATEVIEEENTLTSPSERDSFASYCKRRDLVRKFLSFKFFGA